MPPRASTTPPTSRPWRRWCVAHGGRPHWGKLHSLDADRLALLHPLFDEFLALRDRLDPDRLFTNAYLRRVLGD